MTIEFKKVPFPEDKCIHHLFEEWAALTPDSVAVVFGGRQLTYRDLNTRANQLANYLIKKGIRPEELVGICLERSLEMVIAIAGILKAGGAYLPLDPDYPPERLSFMLDDSKVRLLLSLKESVHALPDMPLTTVLLDEDWDLIAGESCLNLALSHNPESLAYVIYTSGSTGRPKGVMISHRNVVGFLFSFKQVILDDEQRIGTMIASFSFDVSVEEMFSTICFGGRLHIVRPEHSADAEYFSDYLIKHNITTTYIVPDLLWEVAGHLEQMKDQLKLKCLLTGLAPKKQKILQRFRDLSDELRILNTYGPTEVTYGSTAFEFISADDPEKDVPIGKPFPNYEVYIADANLNPVPVGVRGEILIGGVGLARGYLNRPELTEEKFITNPFQDETGHRLYRTGDLGRCLSDGNIEFLGRIDNQVKIRGYRVEPGEIESILTLHPQIRQAVVIAREDRPGDKRLVAYIIPHKGETVSPKKLRLFLRGKLPEYMVPSAFVVLKTLPLLPNGKVDRQAFPVPDTSRGDTGKEYLAPHTPDEEILADIWADVLGLEMVGTNDNFFEIGGHSLLATRIISRVRKIFGVDPPLSVIFEQPTIAGLAALIKPGSFETCAAHFTPIVRIARDIELPLSFPQERLWFIHQLHPGILAYNFESALWMHGLLNIEALEKSLNEIVRQHEIYRTTFPSIDGRPVQEIHKYRPFILDIVELSVLKETERKPAAMRIISEEYRIHFDLSVLPLVRWKLLRISPEEYVLVHTEHHLVHDGWSFNIFLGELSRFYNAFSAGTPPDPTVPEIQFADFAYWQRQWMQGETAERQLNYWSKQLAGVEQLMELPLDRPRPAIQTFNGESRLVELPAGLCEALRALSRQEGITLYMTMLAGFIALLHRYSGNTDICVGAGVANRRWHEIEGTMGMVINTVALRTDLSGGPDFRDVLRRVREVCLGAYVNQDLPFNKVVEMLQPQRSLSYSPLFQVMFSFHDSPLSDINLSGLDTRLVEGLSQSAKSDLNVVVIPRSEQQTGQTISERRNGITLVWEYNTDLFDSTTMTRMIGHYQRLLEGIAKDCSGRLSALPILTEAEQHQLLFEWNDTKKEYPRDKCIHELFEEQVERTPEAVAIVYDGEQLTYKELNARSNLLAHYLRAKGVGPEALVGICIERSIEMIVGILGILKAGGAYLPLDPSYPKERLAFMMEDANVPVLLTQRRLLERFPETMDALCLDSDQKEIAQSSEENPFCEARSENLAYVMYTSGSTGKPKGVCIQHRSIVRLVKGVDYADLTEKEVFLQLASLSFDASTFEIWGCLVNGGRLVIMPRHTPSLEELGRAIKDYQITTLWLTAGLFHLMVDERNRDLGHLRQLLAGGDVLSVNHVKKFLQQHPHCRLINGYGPTENTTFTCCYPMTKVEKAGESVPIGRPISNTRVYILDTHMQLLPVGVPGELYIGGDGLARGYLNQPELTAEKFIPDTFSKEPGARLYKTGDLARYLPDGNIEFIGRLDLQVKIRGFRIEPGEIETILGQHPSVREAVVVVREDHPGDKRLAAYVVLKEKSFILPDELRGFLKEKLPEYMIPSFFMLLGELPITPNGKVDRKALTNRDIFRNVHEKNYLQPETSTEKILARIWKEVLGIEKVGVNDNFFELGGHSLMIFKVFSRIEQEFGRELQPSVLFQFQTIAQLATVIDRNQEKSETSPIVPIRTQGNLPPLFVIAPIGVNVMCYMNLVKYLSDKHPIYGIDSSEDVYNSSMDKTVSAYIAEIRKIVPEGPFYLIGYSSAGTMAFEMAWHLDRMGLKVPFVALLDSLCHMHYGKKITWRKPDTILRFLKNLPFWFYYYWLHMDNRASRIRGRLAEIFGYKVELQSSDSFVAYQKRAKKVVEWLRPCEKKNYAGHIILFRAKAQVLFSSSSFDKGWNELAETLDIHEVPGHHSLIMKEPYVRTLAEAINRELERRY